MKLLSVPLAFSLLLTASVDIQAAEKQLTWTPEVIITTKVISDVQLSPTNESILFVVTEPQVKDEKNALSSKIYKRDLHKEDATLFLATDMSSMQPRWSPDGEWIAFLSIQEGVKNLYLIPSDGGEPIALTNSKKDVQTFAWSPDSRKIAFVMMDETEAEQNRKKTSLAYVYNEVRNINRLWLIEDVLTENPTFRPLTGDDYCVRGCGDFGTTNTEFDWSPDAKKITFAYSPAVGFDYFHLDSSLATIDLVSGKVFPWEKQALYEALPRYSSDGQQVAYVSGNTSERYAIDRQVAIRSFHGKERQFLAPTFNEGAFLAGPSLLGWSRDGKHVLFFEPKGTKYHLVWLPTDGSPAKEVDTGDLFFKEPALSLDRSQIGFVVQSPATPPEAFVAKIDDFKLTQISSVNQSLLAYPKTETELVSWKSKDGMSIEGLLTYPMGFEEYKKYPLLLVIHGGPMGFFDETFLGTANPYPLASFAQEGFFVFRPNPRGSSGYGKKFRSANYKDWGGADFSDIMAGGDHLIAKGIVDPEKLGVMGWSYGGYMTAWTITQTNRFKAASMGAGLCNLVSMNGTTDLYRFLTDYLGGFEDSRKLYEERSPINFVQNVKTPCLIQHGTTDKRVPVSQAYEFFHGLDRLGKETTLVLYPGMEHRLSDPDMQMDAMKRNLNWFQKYLLDP
jgi:dipeptidyl aminopeptidase/acylaminoacyl peptidase